MAVNLSPVGGVAAQFFDNSGYPLTGGKLYSYLAGTSTPATTYTSSNGSTAHSNPIVLDAAGRVPAGGEIWLTDGINYKFVLKTSTDTLIATYDNITGINSNAVAYTSQQEIVTATAGQTVFNLGISYQPGTNSLSVFVDGVNQYGPGAQYSYVETDANTVTFNNGLHVGASVKFTTSQQQGAGAADATQVSYEPPFTASVATNVAAKLAQTVSVKDFGAKGDGVTDDTAAIQAALDCGVYRIGMPAGTYIISSTLTIPVYVSLVGEEKTTTIIETTGGIDGIELNSYSGLYGITIQAPISGEASTKAIKLNGKNNTIIDNVITAYFAYGVYSYGSNWLQEFRNIRINAPTVAGFWLSNTADGALGSALLGSGLNCWLDTVYVSNNDASLTPTASFVINGQMTIWMKNLTMDAGSAPTTPVVLKSSDGVVIDVLHIEGCVVNTTPVLGGAYPAAIQCESVRAKLSGLRFQVVTEASADTCALISGGANTQLEISTISGSGSNNLVNNFVLKDSTYTQNRVYFVNVLSSLITTKEVFSGTGAGYFVTVGALDIDNQDGTLIANCQSINVTQNCVFNQKQITGSGTVISIPHTSQTSANKQHLTEVFVVCQQNNGPATGGTCQAIYRTLTTVASLTQLSVTGNISSVTASGLNLQINLNTSITDPLIVVKTTGFDLIEVNNATIA